MLCKGVQKAEDVLPGTVIRAYIYFDVKFVTRDLFYDTVVLLCKAMQLIRYDGRHLFEPLKIVREHDQVGTFLYGIAEKHPLLDAVFPRDVIAGRQLGGRNL